VLRGWGEVCEELGMARMAEECYRDALRLAPQDGETHYRLALLLAEVGHFERSLHSLKKAVKCNPEHQAARELLAQNYRALGLFGQGQALVPQEQDEAPESSPRYFPPSISDRDTGEFLRLFSGREVGFALQQVDPRTGDVVYAYRDCPLDHDLIVSHLLGGTTLAGYPMRSDNTVQCAAVAVRASRRTLKENVKNRGYLAYMEEGIRHHVLVLARYARQLGLPAYPEETGEHECRLWFFFREFVHFLKIKRYVHTFLERAPAPEVNLIVEPLLATKPVGVGWVEHPIVLPLGVQRSTLRRSLFLDKDGEPVGEQLKFLRKIRKISLKIASERLRTSACGRESPVVDMRDASGAVRTVLRRCAVLRELSRKAGRGRILHNEEKLILFYTVGLADPDGDSLHRLLEPCPDYDYEKVKRQAARLRPNPMSCHKIRELIPEITASVACNCSFDLRGGKYPSPLLHVDPCLVPASQELSVPGNIPIQEAARRYVNLRRHMGEVRKALARLEHVLEKELHRRGTDRIKVDRVTLKRSEEPGRPRWLME
jgi:hypothetical protein